MRTAIQKSMQFTYSPNLMAYSAITHRIKGKVWKNKPSFKFRLNIKKIKETTFFKSLFIFLHHCCFTIQISPCEYTKTLQKITLLHVKYRMDIYIYIYIFSSSFFKKSYFVLHIGKFRIECFPKHTVRMVGVKFIITCSFCTNILKK